MVSELEKKQNRIANEVKSGKKAKLTSPKRKRQSQEEARSGSGSIPFKDLKSGALRRQLKVGEDGKALTKSEMSKIVKVENGEEFKFRGNTFKMTPLLKKRATLAESMIGFKKR
jgi:hypothetical protein